jgi:hypothetical protein
MSRRLDAVVNADGSAQIDWNVEVIGSGASAWRQRYHATATQRQRVQEDLGNEIPGLDVQAVSAGDLDDVERKVEIKAKGKAPSFARKDGETRTIGAGPREYLVRNYAPLSARHRDIRIQALSTQSNETIVKLPQGAKILAAPRASTGTTPYGTYNIETDVNGTTVRMKTTVTMTKSRIPASEYGKFRAFCEQVDRELGQTLTYTVSK